LELNANWTGAAGASQEGYVFGACAILRAKKPPQPAVLKTSTSNTGHAHNLSRIGRS